MAVAVVEARLVARTRPVRRGTTTMPGPRQWMRCLEGATATTTPPLPTTVAVQLRVQRPLLAVVGRVLRLVPWIGLLRLVSGGLAVAGAPGHPFLTVTT